MRSLYLFILGSCSFRTSWKGYRTRCSWYCWNYEKQVCNSFLRWKKISVCLMSPVYRESYYFLFCLHQLIRSKDNICEGHLRGIPMCFIIFMFYTKYVWINFFLRFIFSLIDTCSTENGEMVFDRSVNGSGMSKRNQVRKCRKLRNNWIRRNKTSLNSNLKYHFFTTLYFLWKQNTSKQWRILKSDFFSFLLKCKYFISELNKIAEREKNNLFTTEQMYRVAKVSFRGFFCLLF